MRRNIFSVAITIFGTLVLLLPGLASAISTGGIGARPANPDPDNERTKSIFVYDIEPGGSVNDAVLVSNNTDEDKTIEVYAVDGQTTNSGSFACKQKVEAKTGAGGWITLSQSEVKLASGTQQEVPLQINLPKQVSVGEHNACIVVAEADSETQDGGGVSLRFRSALRVAISVPGDIKKSLTLENVQLEETSTGDYVLIARLNNTGNVSLDADIKARIKGFIVQSVENGGVFPILPNESAVIRLEVKKPYWGGFYRAEASVAYDVNPDNRLGQTENADITTKSVASGWQFIAPKKQAMAALAGILLAVAGVIAFVLFKKGILRNPRHRELGRYKVKPGQDLPSIADTFNVDWKSLARINQIKPPYTLKEGSIIKVPKLRQKRK